MGGAGESAETETVRDRVHEWELDEPRGSRPVLGARGGEIPLRDSPTDLEAKCDFREGDWH